MIREEAIELVRSKTDKAITMRHLISVEGVMRRLAQHFEENEDHWALTGLFHDLDQDETANDPERHARLAAEWLKEADAPADVINGVLAHAHPEYQTDLMSRAIVAADALAGLLVAAALPRPDKATGMKVSSVKKKLKEKSFAPGVNRNEIHACSEIGIELDQFIGLGIEGLQIVAEDIGL
ncbi:MAG: HD domain-containing protein [Actinomycetota bacterium]|nr:HDIG domain-containing protein [Actinomycetota bacterium]